MTQELLETMLAQNPIPLDEIASIFFTLTEDLDAEFPAVAARHIGLSSVPMLCFREVPVPGSLSRCVRVLMQVNSDRPQSEFSHVYLRAAKSLRPDLAKDK